MGYGGAFRKVISENYALWIVYRTRAEAGSKKYMSRLVILA
jgi:hypothetical protein